jgi:glucosamine kinase
VLLIADSGSTKTDWVLIDNTQNQFRFATHGYNPYFIGTDQICQSLQQELLPQLDASSVKKIFFYGAGCSTPEKKAILHVALTKCFVNAEITIEHDLLAAAYALLGHQRGFAAILGTGSNTCIFDGVEIEKNIDSLGYLLGDEGSGCSIGKKLLRDFLRGCLPPDLEKQFRADYPLSQAEIFDAMYNKPLPNRFLAGFCKFAAEHKNHAGIKKILEESFSDFFLNLVSKYPDYQTLSFNCVGSVGYHFREQLSKTAAAFGMKMGNIIPSPMEGLVRYHIQKRNASEKGKQQ